MKTDFMSECAKAASWVLEYSSKGDNKNAGIILSSEAERIGRKHNATYSSFKQSIGVFLQVAA